jgi:hypothetical protein
VRWKRFQRRRTAAPDGGGRWSGDSGADGHDRDKGEAWEAVLGGRGDARVLKLAARGSERGARCGGSNGRRWMRSLA